MKLKNFLIVVSDMERSKEFYRELFGLQVVLDFGENVTLTDGLVLQERKLWESFTEKKVLREPANNAELYFEENDFDEFLQKLKECKWDITYVNQLKEHDWGQRVVRFYDLDGHMIEVGESMDFVVRRFLKDGMSVEDTAKKTQMPLEYVKSLKV